MREAVTMPLNGEGTWGDVGIGLGYLVAVTAILTLMAQRAMKWK